MAVFFISPTPEDTARMHHLLAGYDLPARIVPAQTRLLDTVNDPGQNSLFCGKGKYPVVSSSPPWVWCF